MNKKRLAIIGVVMIVCTYVGLALAAEVRKGGANDLSFATPNQGAATTWQSGGGATVTYIDAAHIPFRNFNAYVDDLVDGGYDVDIKPANITGDGTDTISGFNIPLYVTADLSLLDAVTAWTDVRAHGAVGDGVTNDTTAIQAAINAVDAAGGGVVYFPPATYLTDRLIVGDNNITLAGAGAGASVLQAVSSYSISAPFSGAGGLINIYPTDGVYSYPSGGSSITNVSIRNLSLIGVDTSGAYDGAKQGITADAVYNLRIENVNISKMRGESILISPANAGDYPVVTNCIITGGSDGIGINKSFGARISNNIVHTNYSGNGIGFSGSGTTATGNIVKNVQTSSFYCGGSGYSGSLGEANVIANNVSYGAGQSGAGFGIYINDDGAEGVTTRDYLLEGNVISNTNGNRGIYLYLLESTSTVYVIGNQISGTGTVAGAIAMEFIGAATYYVSSNIIVGDASQTFGVSRDETYGTPTIYLTSNTITGHSSGDINNKTEFVMNYNHISDNNVWLGNTSNKTVLGQALVNLGGGDNITLGTIGGSGPASAGQNSWMPMVDKDGNAFWVPVWK